MKSTPAPTTLAKTRWNFFEFTQTMQAYKAMVSDDTTVVMSTDSDVFKFLKGMKPDQARAEVPPPTADVAVR